MDLACTGTGDEPMVGLAINIHPFEHPPCIPATDRHQPSRCFSGAWIWIRHTGQFWILANWRDPSAKKCFQTGWASWPSRSQRHRTGFCKPSAATRTVQTQSGWRQWNPSCPQAPKNFCPLAEMPFFPPWRSLCLYAQHQQPGSMTSSGGVRPSLSDCRSASAAPRTVDSSFTLNHLFPVSEVPTLTTLLHNSFNKAHYFNCTETVQFNVKGLKKT